jgi:hypothetical protein
MSMPEEQESQGFKVRDRRTFSTDGEKVRAEEKQAQGQERGPQPAREAGEQAAGAELPLPEPSFSAFLTFFFFRQTLMFLGEFPHPETQRIEKNLPMAKYLIDTLGVIKEKTQGNLTPEEKSQLDAFLTELRMHYVRAI